MSLFLNANMTESQDVKEPEAAGQQAQLSSDMSTATLEQLLMC